MVVEVGKVLGRIASGWWAQVHDYLADPSAGSGQAEQAHKRGRLVACASLHNPAQPDQLEMVAAGREVLARLHELYYGNLAGDPLTALKRAGTGVAAEFPDLELVCLAIVNGAIYVAVVGAAGVWSKVASREGWIVNPSRAGQGVPGLSGWLKPGQVLVAGNSTFCQVLSLGAVRAAVANSAPAAEMAEALTAVVHGQDTGMGGVGVVVHILPLTSQVSKINTRPPIIERVRTTLAGFMPKPAGPIYISATDKTKSRRRNMYAGIGFLVLLLLLVGGWQWRRMYVENKLGERNQRIEELVHKFNEAQSLAQLNPVRSRQLLAEVEASLPGLKNSKKPDERIAQVEAGFGQVLGVASGVKLATAQEVLDLDWLRSGMTGSRLGLVEGKLVVLDSEGDRLAVVDPAKQSGAVISGQTDLGVAKLMAVYPGKITVLSDKGLVECDLAGSCQTKVPFDSAWGQVVDMQMFAGNIYLLTPAGVWRHQVTDTGYGPKQAWLAGSEDTSQLGSSSNLAIDASLWVMQTTGQILKYTRGVREDFVLTDLDQPFAPGAVIYTDPEAELLYILDRGNGRVVVLAKTGAYQLQYQFDQAKEAQDLAVDEAGGQMYLLAGSKILSVKL